MKTRKIDSDSHKEFNFERPQLMRSMVDMILVPILNSLPAKSRDTLKKTHYSAAYIVDHKTTHNALENLYQEGLPDKSKTLVQKISHHVWFGTANVRAVRNRLRIVKRRIKTHLEKTGKQSTTNILSIASGSARAVIEGVDDLDLEYERDLEIHFLDKNPHALAYSKEMIQKSNIPLEKCVWVEGTAGSYLDELKAKGKAFDLVEMVGLLDYFNDAKCEKTFSQIYEILEPGGALITANINHNREKKFITNVVGWAMIYRTPEELALLLEKAGFKKEKMEILVEPFGVHTVIVAEK